MSAAVPVDGGRGWTSFALLIFELNLIVWAGTGPAHVCCGQHGVTLTGCMTGVLAAS